MDKRIKEVLKDGFELYYRRDLLVDGYKVSIVKRFDTPTKMVYVVYVDGEIRGICTGKDHPIGQKFYNPKVIRPSKQDVQMQRRLLKYKGVKGKALTAQIEEYKAPIIFAYSPIFTSIQGIIKKLNSCTSVEMWSE